MKHLLSDLSKRALISDEQAALIVGQAAESRETEIRLLLRQGLVDQQVLATELGRVFDLPIATRWPSQRVLPDAISLRFMRERHVLPSSIKGDKLSVVVSDPSDEATLNALRLASGTQLRATAEALRTGGFNAIKQDERPGTNPDRDGYSRRAGSLGITQEMPFTHLVMQSYHIGLADGPVEVHKVTVARQLLREFKPSESQFPSYHLHTRREAAGGRRCLLASSSPKMTHASSTMRPVMSSTNSDTRNSSKNLRVSASDSPRLPAS